MKRKEKVVVLHFGECGFQSYILKISAEYKIYFSHQCFIFIYVL